MAEKVKVVLLRQALDVNKGYKDLILQEDVPIVCVNWELKKQRTMPFKALYDNNNEFYLHNKSWEYYITGDNFNKLKELASEKSAWTTPSASQPSKTPPQAPAPQVVEIEIGFGSEYEALAAMSLEEQVQVIQDDKKHLDTLIVAKPRDEKKITAALVETFRDTALINHAVLMDAMKVGNAEAKKQTQEIVNSTCAWVKASTQLINPDIFDDELMTTLVEKSNGTIIQHMTRVYINGVAFLSYYNKLVSTSSIINKLRISFEKNYRAFYQKLLPHIYPGISLEKVFLGGMRAVPEKQFFEWAVGFLIHDVGKAAAVEYHEGESAFNRDIVVEHVKVGYNSVMNKTNYPRGAGLITGYHHEYYGDESGYGYFRSYLDQYKKRNPSARQDYCITFEIEPMLDYIALAFFPAKVLEIIDIYDSVTDPNRKYRKALTPEEALAMMKDEFIVKHHKIDFILYDIFAGFVRTHAVHSDSRK